MYVILFSICLLLSAFVASFSEFRYNVFRSPYQWTGTHFTFHFSLLTCFCHWLRILINEYDDDDDDEYSRSWYRHCGTAAAVTVAKWSPVVIRRTPILQLSPIHFLWVHSSEKTRSGADSFGRRFHIDNFRQQKTAPNQRSAKSASWKTSITG